MKSIKLGYGSPRGDKSEIKDYQVLVVKNSTVYSPGEVLERTEVDDLCLNKNWDVTIVTLKDQH